MTTYKYAMIQVHHRFRCSRLLKIPRMSARQFTVKRTTGYETFGSFHAPSTDELFESKELIEDISSDIPLPKSSLHVGGNSYLDTDSSKIALNRSHFCIDFTKWTFLNHGAFGGTSKFSTEVANKWRESVEHQPLEFYDRKLFQHIVQSIKALSAMIGVENARDLVLLPNATAGLHATISSVWNAELTKYVNGKSILPTSSRAEPVIICFSPRYGAVRKMLDQVANDSKLQLQQLHIHEEVIPYEQSLDNEKVMYYLSNAIKSTSAKNQQCILLVVDHISSNTGVLMPVADIIEYCHEHSIPVLVDGAHGLFNLSLSLDKLQADYYVGNCHKWFCSPKGAAFLHVNRRDVPIKPRIISHGALDGLQSSFMWTGLQDYSPWLSLRRSIEYWKYQDIDNCRKYMHNLIQTATEHMYKTWGMDKEYDETSVFPQSKRHAMRLVKLPPGTVFGVKTYGNLTSSTEAKHIQDRLHIDYHIEVPIKCVDKQLYVRISAHVYNNLNDYNKLAQTIKDNWDN